MILKHTLFKYSQNIFFNYLKFTNLWGFLKFILKLLCLQIYYNP